MKRPTTKIESRDEGRKPSKILKNSNGTESTLLRTDMNKKMELPTTDASSSNDDHESCAPAPNRKSPKKLSRILDELSEDSKDHDDDCLFMLYFTRRESLMTDEEVRSAFIANIRKIKNRKKRQLALRKLQKTLESNGHVMEYLKFQREYFDSLKKQFINLCECYEDCNDSSD